MREIQDIEGYLTTMADKYIEEIFAQQTRLEVVKQDLLKISDKQSVTAQFIKHAFQEAREILTEGRG